MFLLEGVNIVSRGCLLLVAVTDGELGMVRTLSTGSMLVAGISELHQIGKKINP